MLVGWLAGRPAGRQTERRASRQAGWLAGTLLAVWRGVPSPLVVFLFFLLACLPACLPDWLLGSARWLVGSSSPVLALLYQLLRASRQAAEQADWLAGGLLSSNQITTLLFEMAAAAAAAATTAEAVPSSRDAGRSCLAFPLPLLLLPLLLLRWRLGATPVDCFPDSQSSLYPRVPQQSRRKAFGDTPPVTSAYSLFRISTHSLNSYDAITAIRLRDDRQRCSALAT